MSVQRDEKLVDAGEGPVRVGKVLWTSLKPLRVGAPDDRGVVPVRPVLPAT